MATFTASSLKSTTLENAALEIITKLQILEADETKNSTGKNFTQLTIDTDRKIASLSFNVPIELTTNATTGAVEIIAQTYLA